MCFNLPASYHSGSETLGALADVAEDEVADCLPYRAVSHEIQQKNNDRQRTSRVCSYGTMHMCCVLSETSTVCLCLHAHRRGKL